MDQITSFSQSLPEPVRLTLFALGAFLVFNFTFTCVRGVYARCLRGGKNLKRRYGSWAVVTGATDGIGLAMAKEFAKKGLNVLLISRTQEKLDACKKDIKDKCPGVEVETLAINYESFDDQAQNKVKSAVNNKEVGILVNNVGISYPFPKYYDELDDKQAEQLMSLNVTSTTLMTRIVLPGMISRKKGAIVNVSSAAGVTVSPLLAGYSAAKGYIAAFSKSLHYELAGKGIDVQCQVPLYVTTKLAKLKHPSLFVASPGAYARAAVAAIGYEALVSPYWSHALQMWLIWALPEWLVALGVKKMHLDIRRRGMKKEMEAAGGSASASSSSSRGGKKQA